MIDSGLQVLVQERLEFFILLVEESSIFNQVLSVDEQLVIFREGLVQGSPQGHFVIRKNFGHFLPE